jgi:hypothetical protein
MTGSAQSVAALSAGVIPGLRCARDHRRPGFGRRIGLTTLEISPSMANDVMVSLTAAASCLRRKSRSQPALAAPTSGATSRNQPTSITFGV